MIGQVTMDLPSNVKRDDNTGLYIITNSKGQTFRVNAQDQQQLNTFVQAVNTNTPVQITQTNPYDGNPKTTTFNPVAIQQQQQATATNLQLLTDGKRKAGVIGNSDGTYTDLRTNEKITQEQAQQKITEAGLPPETLTAITPKRSPSYQAAEQAVNATTNVPSGLPTTPAPTSAQPPPAISTDNTRTSELDPPAPAAQPVARSVQAEDVSNYTQPLVTGGPQTFTSPAITARTAEEAERLALENARNQAQQTFGAGTVETSFSEARIKVNGSNPNNFTYTATATVKAQQELLLEPDPTAINTTPAVVPEGEATGFTAEQPPTPALSVLTPPLVPLEQVTIERPPVAVGPVVDTPPPVPLGPLGEDIEMVLPEQVRYPEPLDIDMTGVTSTSTTGGTGNQDFRREEIRQQNAAGTGSQNTASAVSAARVTGANATQRNARQQEDWRVRLTLAPSANYLYNSAKEGDILYPLKGTSGVIFPYTPTINVNYRANYDPADITHSNYKYYFYKNSSVDDITIGAEFTAQDTTEALYMLAVIHFFKSVTKMFYGLDKNPAAGTPPPLCYLFGYGQYQFSDHPLLITSFQYNLPNDVDYIRAGSTSQWAGQNVGAYRTPASNTSQGGIMGILQSARLRNTPKGAISPAPDFSGLSNSKATYVPTKISLTITALPVVTRRESATVFSLENYAKGDLLKKGFW